MERAEGLLGGKFLFKFLLENDATIDKTKVVCCICQAEFSDHRSSSSLSYHCNQGWINERAYRAQAQGPLSQSLCVKSLLCISYLWLRKVYFVHLLMGLIEYTCAVLENVHVRQGRNYRQCSQRGRFVGRADPAFYIFPNIWTFKVSLVLCESDQG